MSLIDSFNDFAPAMYSVDVYQGGILKAIFKPASSTGEVFSLSLTELRQVHPGLAEESMLGKLVDSAIEAIGNPMSTIRAARIIGSAIVETEWPDRAGYLARRGVDNQLQLL